MSFNRTKKFIPPSQRVSSRAKSSLQVSSRQVSIINHQNYQKKVKQIELSLSTVQNWINNDQAVLDINQSNLSLSTFNITDNSIYKFKEIVYKKKNENVKGAYHTGYIVRINELSPLQIISALQNNNFSENNKIYLAQELLNNYGSKNNGEIESIDAKNIAKVIYNDNIKKIFTDRVKYIHTPGNCKPCPTHLFSNPAYSKYPDTIDFIKLDVSYLPDKCDDVKFAINPSAYIPKSRPSGYKSDILFIDNTGNIDQRYQKFVIHREVTLVIDGINKEYVIIGHPNMFEMTETLHNHINYLAQIQQVYDGIMSNNKTELVKVYNAIMDLMVKDDKSPWKLYNEITGNNGIINNENEIFKLCFAEAVGSDLRTFDLIYKILEGGNIELARQKLKKLLDYLAVKYNENTLANIGFPCDNIKYQFQVFVKNGDDDSYLPAFLTPYDLLPEHMPILDEIDNMISTDVTPLFGIPKTERFINFVRMGDIFTVNAIYLGTNDNIYEYNYVYSSMIQYSVFKHYVRYNLYLSGNEIPAYRYRNYKFVEFSETNDLPKLGDLNQPEKSRDEIRKDFAAVIRNPNISLDTILNDIVTIDGLKKQFKKTNNSTTRNTKNKKSKSIRYTKSVKNTINTSIIPKNTNANIYFLTFVKLQSEQCEFTIRYTNNNDNITKYYYGLLRKSMMDSKSIFSNIAQKIPYLNNSEFDISLIKLGKGMESYQPYQLEYLEEITPTNMGKLGIPFFDYDGILSTIGFITSTDKYYTNRPYNSLNMSKKPDDTSLDENELELQKLKYMSRTIVDMYLFLKKTPLKNETGVSIIYYGDIEKINDNIINGSNDKLVALSNTNVRSPILNKLGPERAQVANEIITGPQQEAIANAIELNKNCVWFFDKRFLDSMEIMVKEKYNNQANWKNILVNLYKNDAYKYFLNDYSALKPEHYNDLKEIINELCKKLYGDSYDNMKDKLCIKFHNFNSCTYKVLHMHIGPESNYYNYEKFNRHNIMRDFKNLLASHVLFCINSTDFAFDNGKDNIYTTRFGDFQIYV